MMLIFKKLFFSLVFLNLFSLVGLIVLNSLHAHAKSGIDVLPALVMKYFFILSGPTGTIITMIAQTDKRHIVLMLGLTVFSVIGWFYWLFKGSGSAWRMSIPVAIWVALGLYSAFYNTQTSVLS